MTELIADKSLRYVNPQSVCQLWDIYRHANKGVITEKQMEIAKKNDMCTCFYSFTRMIRPDKKNWVICNSCGEVYPVENFYKMLEEMFKTLEDGK